MPRLRLCLATILLAATAGTLGCAFGEIRWTDPMQRQISLEDAQQRYTVLVRWSDFDKAAKFVDPEQRAAYLSNFPDFREIRFTEFESDELEIDSARETATVEVKYYAYSPSSPVETAVSETQEWYRDSSIGNDWRVRSTFNGLDAILARH